MPGSGGTEVWCATSAWVDHNLRFKKYRDLFLGFELKKSSFLSHKHSVHDVLPICDLYQSGASIRTIFFFYGTKWAPTVLYGLWRPLDAWNQFRCKNHEVKQTDAWSQNHRKPRPFETKFGNLCDTIRGGVVWHMYLWGPFDPGCVAIQCAV